MSTFECERLAESYAAWIRQNIQVKAVGESCVLTSPFVDRHRDFLQIYVEKTNEGLLLSDDGYVLRDLHISGLDPDTEHRREAFETVLRSFGVSMQDGELRVLATNRTFAQRKHDLVQAMLAVGDLVYMARPTVVSLFKEDVAKFLGEKGVRFVADLKLTGQSGLDHPFDFVIAASARNPEHYIRAVSSPDKDNIVSLMFSWEDVRTVRKPDAIAYAILNDTERRVSPDLLTALARKQIKVMSWADRETQGVPFPVE